MSRYALKDSDLKIAILRGKNFQSTTGSMRGERVVPGDVILPGTGWLPEAWQERLKADNPVYVVFSYRTPIAWAVPTELNTAPKWNPFKHQWDQQSEVKSGYWVVPNVKYSSTTTRHQAVVRATLRTSGFVPTIVTDLEEEKEV